MVYTSYYKTIKLEEITVTDVIRTKRTILPKLSHPNQKDMMIICSDYLTGLDIIHKVTF